LNASPSTEYHQFLNRWALFITFRTCICLITLNSGFASSLAMTHCWTHLRRRFRAPILLRASKDSSLLSLLVFCPRS
jgi:hypothetical protein